MERGGTKLGTKMTRREARGKNGKFKTKRNRHGSTGGGERVPSQKIPWEKRETGALCQEGKKKKKAEGGATNLKHSDRKKNCCVASFKAGGKKTEKKCLRWSLRD